MSHLDDHMDMGITSWPRFGLCQDYAPTHREILLCTLSLGRCAVDAGDDDGDGRHTAVTSRHDSGKTNAIGWHATGYPFAKFPM
jgi:hypothetical protein